MSTVKEKSIWVSIEEDIQNSGLDEKSKKKLFNNLLNLKTKKINILITGATGSGKSSTINAIFDTEVAKVGYGVDPETMDIQKYELDNLILWDSPGLGDGKEADIRHSKNIINKLVEKDKEGKALIDLVLVILDGSSRDLGTSYQLINEVIIPNLPEKERILVAINQCDIAMKGKGWDNHGNVPEPVLNNFLDEKVDSVRRRIKEGTGVDIEPIYYSAEKFYNISKLFSFIVKHTPKEKRAVYIDNVNKDPNPWKSNDDIKDYNDEIKKSFMESIKDGMADGADIGGDIGRIFGKTGETVGRIAGGVVGAIVGGIKGLFGW
ncbi:50S ribosome-binding GTPase [Domibacillus sp. A3M-37]|uniref:GTPase family protein n=1 Tax=Domibacillus sp. A3M-37 TaxID=2962037 RepID=UPI0020B7DBBB|nr:GTPase [Domibacillus sp. A3M-37]MCP3764579.1 50S ribosome-binding GTPase [Domibacillus sp. A3M-37]